MFWKLGNRKREKLANTTTLANETIIKKEGKDESGESRKFGKNRKSNKNVSLQQEKHAVKYRKVETLKNECFSFSYRRTKTDVFKYDDVIHLILLALRMLCKGFYRTNALPSF